MERDIGMKQKKVLNFSFSPSYAIQLFPWAWKICMEYFQRIGEFPYNCLSKLFCCLFWRSLSGLPRLICRMGGMLLINRHDSSLRIQRDQQPQQQWCHHNTADISYPAEFCRFCLQNKQCVWPGLLCWKICSQTLHMIHQVNCSCFSWNDFLQSLIWKEAV